MASSGGQQRDFEIATGRSERAWGVVDRSLQLCTRAKTARALFRRFRSSSFSRAARWLQRRWKPRLRLRHQPPRTLLLPLPLQHWRLKTMPLNLPLQHRHPKPLPLPRPGAHAAIGPAWSAAYTTWESFPYAEYRSLPLVPPRLLAHRPSSSVVEASLRAPQLSRPASRGSHWWLWAGVRSRCSAPNQRPRHAGQPRPKLRILRHLNQHPGQAQEEEAQAEAEAAVTGGASRQPQGQPGLARPAQRPRTGHVP